MSMNICENIKNQSNDGGGIDAQNGLRFSIRDCLDGEVAHHLYWLSNLSIFQSQIVWEFLIRVGVEEEDGTQFQKNGRYQSSLGGVDA